MVSVVDPGSIPNENYIKAARVGAVGGAILAGTGIMAAYVIVRDAPELHVTIGSEEILLGLAGMAAGVAGWLAWVVYHRQAVWAASWLLIWSMMGVFGITHVLYADPTPRVVAMLCFSLSLMAFKQSRKLAVLRSTAHPATLGRVFS